MVQNMALRWDYKKDYVGTMTDKEGVMLNCYTGNAQMIALYETENTISLAWFSANKEHLKNMLKDELCRKNIEGMKFDIEYRPILKQFIEQVAGIAELHIHKEAPKKVIHEEKGF